MRFATVGNAVLALLVEFALLAAGVAVGLHLPAPTAVRVVVAVALPALVVAVWSVLLAPRARRRVDPRRRVLLQVALAAAAVVGLAAVGLVPWAIALAVAVAVRLALGVAIGRV